MPEKILLAMPRIYEDKRKILAKAAMALITLTFLKKSMNSGSLSTPFRSAPKKDTSRPAAFLIGKAKDAQYEVIGATGASNPYPAVCIDLWEEGE
jgi:hypothetical protein